MNDANKVEPRKIPEHQAIYGRVRDAILFGDLVPGQAVTIQGVVELIGAGMTPVREALRRLTAEGALLALGNRRIVVPHLSVAQLEELTFARLAIEPKLSEMAVKNVTGQDIERLAEIDTELNAAIAVGSVEKYLYHNHRFHFALYDLANAEILYTMVGMLWLRMGPSLRVVCGRYGTVNLPDMHSQAMDALRNRDTAAVAEAMRQDILQGADQIRTALSESSD